MTLIAENTFLTVNPAQAGQKGERLGILKVAADGSQDYTALSVKWPDKESNDLEAVCPLPGREGEYLAAEGGAWTPAGATAEVPGRIFHLRLSESRGQWKVELLGTANLPASLLHVEGLACYKVSEETVSTWTDANNPADATGWTAEEAAEGQAAAEAAEQANQPPTPPAGAAAAPAPPKTIAKLLIGLRGGDIPYASQNLYKLDLNLGDYSCSAPEVSHYETKGPSSYGDRPAPWIETCTDIYLDAGDQLWIAATQSGGAAGPFRSYIYFAGKVQEDDYFPSYYGSSMVWYLDGLCVRALAKACLPQSVLSVASSDGALGGVWRPLAPAGGSY